MKSYARSSAMTSGDCLMSTREQKEEGYLWEEPDAIECPHCKKPILKRWFDE